MNFRLYREFFRAVANPTRFAIVELLRDRPNHVNEMAEKLGFEQSRISHNLACLLNCGFVEWEWSGKNKVYKLNPSLVPVLEGIEKHLCSYAPALENCRVLDAETRRAPSPTRARVTRRRPIRDLTKKGGTNS